MLPAQKRIGLSAPVVFLILIGGCARPVPVVPPPGPVVPPSPSPRVGPSAIYPDPSRTPGAMNTEITQANIANTICNPNWSTSTIRPSSSYTTSLKKKQMATWGLPGTTADYEEDHLIPLEVGGHPRDEVNLWPQKWNLAENSSDLGAHTKDLVENYIHDEVCFSIPNHKTNSDHAHPATAAITLQRGQEILAWDWYACYLKYLERQPCQ